MSEMTEKADIPWKKAHKPDINKYNRIDDNVMLYSVSSWVNRFSMPGASEIIVVTHGLELSCWGFPIISHFLERILMEHIE